MTSWSTTVPSDTFKLVGVLVNMDWNRAHARCDARALHLCHMRFQKKETKETNGIDARAITYGCGCVLQND